MKATYGSKNGPVWVRRWLPFAILALGAIVLALKWDSIPDRWAIHWGISGRPDGWATRTVVGVFFPLAFGAFICAFLEAIGLILRATAKDRGGLSPEAARTIASLTIDFLRLIQIALSLVFAYIGIALPLSPPESPVRLVWFVFAAVGIAIAVGVMRLLRGVRELKKAGDEGLEGYNGIIYKNPNDSRLWVRKISGLGYTLNFAHPWAWPIMAAILAIPVLVVIALGVP